MRKANQELEAIFYIGLEYDPPKSEIEHYLSSSPDIKRQKRPTPIFPSVISSTGPPNVDNPAIVLAIMMKAQRKLGHEIDLDSITYESVTYKNNKPCIVAKIWR
ncbi:MAG: hypothetical protein WC749_16785 [Dehalococcoidia bacterium]